MNSLLRMGTWMAGLPVILMGAGIIWITKLWYSRLACQSIVDLSVDSRTKRR
jgi:hypothetical protein